jgi:ADP-ribose pyrophosphatase
MSTIKKVAALAQTKFLNLFEATYENKLGNEKTWMIASRKDLSSFQQIVENPKLETVDAVVIVAVHEPSNKMVLVRQFRVPLNDFIYELPAGLIDAKEPIETTLERELKEETGLKLKQINEAKSAKKVYLSAGMTDESVALMYCTCEGEPTTKYLEEDEELDIVLVSKEEAKELLQTASKIDIKAYMALSSFIYENE